MNVTAINPKRGEVWLADLEPTVGAEMGKLRPVLVLNPDRIGRLALRVVVPFTDWKPDYAAFVWMTLLEPDAENGLKKRSAADGFQVASVSLLRFHRRIGTVTAEQLAAIVASVALVIGYESTGETPQP